MRRNPPLYFGSPSAQSPNSATQAQAYIRFSEGFQGSSRQSSQPAASRSAMLDSCPKPRRATSICWTPSRLNPAAFVSPSVSRGAGPTAVDLAETTQTSHGAKRIRTAEPPGCDRGSAASWLFTLGRRPSFRRSRIDACSSVAGSLPTLSVHGAFCVRNVLSSRRWCKFGSCAAADRLAADLKAPPA